MRSNPDPPAPRTFEPSPGQIIDAERAASPNDPVSERARARAALADLQRLIDRDEATAARAINAITQVQAERRLEKRYAEQTRLWQIAFPALIEGGEPTFYAAGYCLNCGTPLGRRQAFDGVGRCAVCISRFGGGGGGGDAPAAAPGPTY